MMTVVVVVVGRSREKAIREREGANGSTGSGDETRKEASTGLCVTKSPDSVVIKDAGNDWNASGGDGIWVVDG